MTSVSKFAVAVAFVCCVTNALPSYQANVRFKQKGVTTTVVKARKTSASECYDRTAIVERHISTIVRTQAKLNGMKGPVSVASSVVTCIPGDGVSINARTLVGLEWYTLRCELHPTGKSQNSAEGWAGAKQEWKRSTRKG